MFRQKQPLTLRIWHWCSALIIFGTLLTVLLRDTFLNGKVVGAVLQKQFANASPDEVKTAARMLRDPMWDWHYYFGFAIAALLFFRLLFGKRHVVPKWKQDFAKGLHYGAVKAGYGVYYLVLMIMSVTGLVMYFSKPLGIPEAAFNTLHDVHETLLWFFLIFIPLHIIGAIRVEVTSEPGYISDMLSGGKQNADEVHTQR